ncbi:hypothetical protein D8Y04_13640 [Listeria seeligeri]|uniref:sce7725 family protein n=1 Tax=Listeria seeligeri TaxID=1640 RepID=UPI001889B824|nr:sce7725 family protein [Listeria seeligeri]MBF2642971.1 sce7725 family protein [Listeria seeligeri]MBM5696233.1 hypothetical protein [Listeria seeligeri]
MYFPILRGKQFELIAIRELAEANVINKITPIIEPIKPSSTLLSTLKQCNQNGQKVGFIHNPQVSNFKKDLVDLPESTLKNDLENILVNKCVIPSHLMNINSSYEFDALKEDSINLNDLIIIHKNADYLSTYNEYFSKGSPLFNLVPDRNPFRREIKNQRVILEDKFNKQTRNSDYCEEEAFSQDHLYFEEEGYKGFADYSIVGEEFIEAGFAPYAVTIHMVYFNDKSELRVRHFMSTSNSDISDPAGKFGQALVKMITWVDENKPEMNTIALGEFRKLLESGKYPGLGTVKKLSIMHHLELVNQYLDTGRLN